MQQNSAQTAGNGGNVPTWWGRMGELPRGHQGARKRQWEAICPVQRSRACVRSLDSGPVTHRTVSWGHWGQCQESPFPSEPRPQNQTLKQDKTECGCGQPGGLKLISGPWRKRAKPSEVWFWRCEGTILCLTWFLFLPEEDALWTGKN